MRTLVFICLILFAGCAESFNVTRDDCYKLLFIDENYLIGYNLFDVQSLKSRDTLYIVSKKVKDSGGKGKDWVELKIGKIINTSIKPVDSLVIMSRTRGSRSEFGYRYDDLFFRKDTMVARKFMSDDISGVYIKKEKVGCK